MDALADGQAADVVLLDLTALSAFTDYFVIATVDNARQMRALLDAIERSLGEAAPGVTVRHEGSFDAGWVLLDLGEVVVHLFDLDRRAYYHLEGLWRGAQEVVRIQ